MKKDKCYRCGGSLNYYHGLMGYEAMKCNKCGHEYAELTKEEYDLNKKVWKLSKGGKK